MKKKKKKRERRRQTECMRKSDVKRKTEGVGRKVDGEREGQIDRWRERERVRERKEEREKVYV